MTERQIRAHLNAKLYPLPKEWRDGWYRASGDALCKVCGYAYRLHPLDPEQLDDKGRKWLHVLCNGDRIKP